jgi:hypothetical protein
VQPDLTRQELVDRVLEKYKDYVNLRVLWHDISTRHPPYRSKSRSSPGAVTFDLRGSKVLISSIPMCVAFLILGLWTASGRTPWYPVATGLIGIAAVAGVISLVYIRRRVRITFTDELCRYESRLLKWHARECPRGGVLIELCSVQLSRLKNTDWTGFGVVVWLTDDDCFAIALASSLDDMRAYAEQVAELLPDITSVHVESNRKISAYYDKPLLPWRHLIPGSSARARVRRSNGP